MLENICMFIDSIADFVCGTVKFLFKLTFYLVVGGVLFYYLSIIPAVVWMIWAVLYMATERPCSCQGQADRQQPLP